MNNRIPGLFLLLFAIWMASCTAPKLDLDEQQVSAVAWMQLSDEYRANCWQTFNCARQTLDHVLETQKFTNPAIIIDVDETILNNSAFQAFLINISAAYSDTLWEEWARAQCALAIPGSLEFLKYTHNREVEIFYVTNRKQSIAAATLLNMQALGFPFSDPEHVLPRLETRSKEKRREKIAASHQVLLYLGDSLNDFPGDYHTSNQENRRAQAEADQGFFGTKYFILPNPVYGAWSNLLIEGRLDLPPQEQAQLRKARLESWQRD